MAHVANQTSFKPGLVPWNKGKRGFIPWNKGTKGIMVPWNKGLRGVQVSWCKGTKGVVKAWNKGIPMSPEQRAAISERQLGRKLTEETKRKISLAHKGRMPANHAMMLRKAWEAQKGRKHTAEHKANISAALKGIPKPFKPGRKSWNAGTKGLMPTPWNKGKTLGKAWNSGKPMPQNSGPLHHSWKGGVSKNDKSRYWSLEYRLWRRAVFARDNFTCQHCGTYRCFLNAHHIKAFAQFPALRFDVTNGITLCRPCHTAEHRRLRLEAA